MDKPLLPYLSWLEFPTDTRSKLVAIFNIPRTGESVVHVGEMMNGNIGARQQSDGRKPQDLYAITVEKMQELLGTKEDNFFTLFKNIVNNIDDFVEIEPVAVQPIEAIKEAIPTAEFVAKDPEELIKPKAGKHAKTKKTEAK